MCDTTGSSKTLQTENEAAVLKKKKKSDDETPSRTVDRRLHRNTTAENKTQLYLRFTGSCSCNPAPEHDRTYYNSSETLSSVRNLNLWLAVASALFNRTVSQISQNDDCILRNPVQSDILKKTKQNRLVYQNATIF